MPTRCTHKKISTSLRGLVLVEHREQLGLSHCHSRLGHIILDEDACRKNRHFFPNHSAIFTDKPWNVGARTNLLTLRFRLLRTITVTTVTTVTTDPLLIPRIPPPPRYAGLMRVVPLPSSPGPSSRKRCRLVQTAAAVVVPSWDVYTVITPSVQWINAEVFRVAKALARRLSDRYINWCTSLLTRPYRYRHVFVSVARLTHYRPAMPFGNRKKK